MGLEFTKHSKGGSSSLGLQEVVDNSGTSPTVTLSDGAITYQASSGIMHRFIDTSSEFNNLTIAHSSSGLSVYTNGNFSARQLRDQIHEATLTGDITLNDSSNSTQVLTPSGSDWDVIVPESPGGQLLFNIRNDGSTYNLAVRTDATPTPTSIITLTPLMAATIRYTGTKWVIM